MKESIEIKSYIICVGRLTNAKRSFEQPLLLLLLRCINYHRLLQYMFNIFNVQFISVFKNLFLTQLVNVKVFYYFSYERTEKNVKFILTQNGKMVANE